MLSYLRIRGLALLEDVTLELAPGMNVLTGETGAGKSIIIDALALLRGSRARADLVRAGTDVCIVDGQFELVDSVAGRVATVLSEHGLPSEDARTLVLQRSVARAGRGRTLVQAELTTQPVLAHIGEQLIDICSQHEHHSLTRVPHHLELLDAYARNDVDLAAYGRTYGEWRDTLRGLEAIRGTAGSAMARADYLRFQLDELERVAPGPGEIEDLKRRVALLRDAHNWADYAVEVHYALDEAESAILAKLSGLLDRARRGAEQSARLASLAEQLTVAECACQEADRLAVRFAGELDFEPGELATTEERLHELVSLQKKHGNLEDLVKLAEGMRRELEAIEHAEERAGELEERAELLRKSAVSQAEALHESRVRASVELGKSLESELEALHLPHARLQAQVEVLGESELGPRGYDRVEFLFSANRGEPLASLTRVASGGELSRVLLALKGVLSHDGSVATYVFDEVDSGVGGAVAAAIAQRLARAASTSQVLCVTHLPQIAAYASAHYHVEKRTENDRTTTRVVRLSEAQRIEELSRMLGGERVTESAREHARQLLEDGRRALAAAGMLEVRPLGRGAPQIVPGPASAKVPARKDKAPLAERDKRGPRPEGIRTQRK